MHTRTRLSALCLAAVSALMLSACSSSSHSPAAAAAGSSAGATAQTVATTGPAPSPTNAASATAGAEATSGAVATTGAAVTTGAVATTAGTGSGPSIPAAAPGLAAKGCTAVKLTDVQPLVKAHVAKVEFDPGAAELDPTHSFQCMVDNPTMTISIHPEDPTKQTYTADVAAENVPAVPLSGVGDVAVWTGVSLTAGSYTSAPNVYAHKGTVTCEVNLSGTGLTIPSETGVVASVTAANAAAFAAKLGALCNDIFAAIG